MIWWSTISGWIPMVSDGSVNDEGSRNSIVLSDASDKAMSFQAHKNTSGKTDNSYLNALKALYSSPVCSSFMTFLAPGVDPVLRKVPRVNSS